MSKVLIVPDETEVPCPFDDCSGEMLFDGAYFCPDCDFEFSPDPRTWGRDEKGKKKEELLEEDRVLYRELYGGLCEWRMKKEGKTGKWTERKWA